MTALAFAALWVPRLWCLAIIGFCCLVAKWVLAQRAQRRADVRTARALARAMWLEDTGPADWQAVQDAVNRVHGDSIPEDDWMLVADACQAIRDGNTTIMDEIARHDIALWELEYQPGDTAA